jgi:ribosomal protein S8
MINNKIADFISRLNTANQLKKTNFFIPYSIQIYKILQIINLHATGILQFQKLSNNTIEIILFKQFSQLKLISTFGRRKYITAKEIISLDRGLGFYILNTSKGVLSSQSALRDNLGGELLLLFS